MDREVKEILDKIEREDEAGPCPTLTEEEVWRLIHWECTQGGITIEELMEHRQTGFWPKGKATIWALDAGLLLELVVKET